MVLEVLAVADFFLERLLLSAAADFDSGLDRRRLPAPALSRAGGDRALVLPFDAAARSLLRSVVVLGDEGIFEFV